MDQTASSAVPWCPSVPVCFPGDGQQTAYNVSPLQITQSEISVGCIPREKFFSSGTGGILVFNLVKVFQITFHNGCPSVQSYYSCMGIPMSLFPRENLLFFLMFSARKIGTKCWLIFIHLSPLTTKNVIFVYYSS